MSKVSPVKIQFCEKNKHILKNFYQRIGRKAGKNERANLGDGETEPEQRLQSSADNSFMGKY
jgi:hypothetical protein